MQMTTRQASLCLLRRLGCAAAGETGLGPASGGLRDQSLKNPFTLTRGYVDGGRGVMLAVGAAILAQW